MKIKEHCKNEAKVTGIDYNKETFFFFFLSMVFWEDITACLWLHTLSVAKALEPFRCFDGGRDWSNQVTYQGILKEFLKNIHIFWKKMMHQNVARAHEEDYSALFHA